MTWAITIGTFLGGVFVVLLMFVIFDQREQIREVLRARWTERKTDSEEIDFER